MHAVLAVIELRRGDLAAAASTSPPVPPPARSSRTSTRAPKPPWPWHKITEARDGPAAALGHLRQLCADLQDRPGLLVADLALAPWLARTARAAGDGGLAASAASAAQALADDHPGFPALAAAAAHSRGLASRDPARLAQAATQHPDSWARASPPKTSASCTLARATGIRPSVT